MPVTTSQRVRPLKGCHSYGTTLEEALDNIKECIQLCEQELEEEGQN